MADFQIQQEFDQTAGDVWKYIGDFAGIASWMPGLQSCVVDGEGIGSVRTIHFNETTFVKEALKALDEGARSLSYSIEEGPIPVQNYLATIEVVDSGSGGCRVNWSARFDLPDGLDPAAITPALSGAYGGALTALKGLLDGAD
jgi:carbon monoxide dehydrogenase subunit G